MRQTSRVSGFNAPHSPTVTTIALTNDKITILCTSFQQHMYHYLGIRHSMSPANGTNAPPQCSSAMLLGIKGEDRGEI